MAVSPQITEKSAEVKRKYRLEFPVLGDPGNRYASELSLTFALSEEMQNVYRGFKLDLPDYNGDDSWTLPLPARMVIGGGGTIRSIDVDIDYTRRPEPESSIEVLRSL